jgi:hypothetical protein
LLLDKNYRDAVVAHTMQNRTDGSGKPACSETSTSGSCQHPTQVLMLQQSLSLRCKPNKLMILGNTTDRPQRCHDEAEKSTHMNEHANRMICGYCSREQNYRPDDCQFCHSSLVAKIGSGFWEGGKGEKNPLISVHHHRHHHVLDARTARITLLLTIVDVAKPATVCLLRQ